LYTQSGSGVGDIAQKWAKSDSVKTRTAALLLRVGDCEMFNYDDLEEYKRYRHLKPLIMSRNRKEALQVLMRTFLGALQRRARICVGPKGQNSLRLVGGPIEATVFASCGDHNLFWRLEWNGERVFTGRLWPGPLDQPLSGRAHIMSWDRREVLREWQSEFFEFFRYRKRDEETYRGDDNLLRFFSKKELTALGYSNEEIARYQLRLRPHEPDGSQEARPGTDLKGGATATRGGAFDVTSTLSPSAMLG
jgi:hypothetical protein